LKPRGPARRLLVPEVVQTSGMDCGAVSLKCLLEGFGIPVSYGRLREACQTDVDGTSIDTMADIACQLGLDAEQVMSPPEHLLLDEAESLPAIAVVRLPNGFTHFVVVWSRIGGLVQVMDPCVGRRWLRRSQLIEELYIHTMPISAAGFRAWAELDGFLRPVGRRLERLGLPAAGVALQKVALADPGWRSLAALDAAARLAESMVRSGGLSPGREAARLVEAMLEQTRRVAPGDEEPIPGPCWSARPGPRGEDGEEQVLLQGAVLVCVRGRRKAAAPLAAGEAPRPLSPELAAALVEPSDQSWRALFRMLREDGLLAPAALAGGLAIATAGLILEALLYRGLLQIGRELPLSEWRLGASAALVVFLAVLLALELPLAGGTLRIGRALEARLRVAFLSKIPRLGDRYFSSRPTSDMAERSHSVHTLREAPALGAALVRAACGLAVTVIAIGWVDAASARPAIVLAALSVLLPFALNTALIERDLRVRTHAGALTRFYLDALLGLVPIRSHTAERAVRREHESLLAEWSLAGRSMLRAALAAEGLQALVGYGAAAWLLFDYVAREGAGARALLLVYWALSLPARGQEIAAGLRRYPALRNTALRLLEPLGAPDDVDAALAGDTAPPSGKGPTPPVAIAFEGVSVHAGGHTILSGIDVAIAAGSHVAIVGASGAGKSSLVGVLLGWYRPAEGRVVIDEIPLDGAGLDRLRRATAWVDPTIQLWNRSFLDNLRYGAPDAAAPLGDVIEDAELRDVLERLPDGQQTLLGEGGGLVSGGEGQRVRLGRAMVRADARLVILDEPFRGLDRERRRTLLERARRLWRRSTLLCVTHDIGETLAFERVLVIDGGHVVEDGAPAELAARPGSRYCALLEAEEAVRSGLWSGAAWRRLRIERGRLVGPQESGGE
jgi:ABC-type bacteriocin/lantibiotic exporter with double-glycine peptidase domain